MADWIGFNGRKEVQVKIQILSKVNWIEFNRRKEGSTNENSNGRLEAASPFLKTCKKCHLYGFKWLIKIFSGMFNQSKKNCGGKERGQ